MFSDIETIINKSETILFGGNNGVYHIPKMNVYIESNFGIIVGREGRQNFCF
jgi:hypothetical protein